MSTDVVYSWGDLGRFTAFLAVFRMMPTIEDSKEIPSNYNSVTRWYANHALDTNQWIMKNTPMQPKGWTDVLWPFKKVCGAIITWQDYLDRRFLGTLVKVEEIIRGDFGNSNIAEMKKNGKRLEELNIIYDQEIKKLAPVADLLLQMTNLANQGKETLSAENLLTRQKNELSQKQLQDINQALENIDWVKVGTTLEKIKQLIQKALNDPTLVSHLDANVAAFEEANKDLTEAKERLARVSQTFQKQAAYLEKLNQQWQKLGLEEDELLKEIEPKACALYEKKSVSQPPISHVRTSSNALPV